MTDCTVMKILIVVIVAAFAALYWLVISLIVRVEVKDWLRRQWRRKLTKRNKR